MFGEFDWDPAREPASSSPSLHFGLSVFQMVILLTIMLAIVFAVGISISLLAHGLAFVVAFVFERHIHLGTLAGGAGLLLTGIAIVLICHLARNSTAYVRHTTRVLVWRRTHKEVDHQLVGEAIRAMLLIGMGIGGLLSLMGFIAVLLGQ